jgi:hypothetical protein
MNIPPILERLLLSNEAVFKNASLGLTGQNMVYVPSGKTAVILEFSIEPFVNDIGSYFEKLALNGSDETSQYINQFQELKERLCYQLQIINDTYSTYFSFQDCFTVVGNYMSDLGEFTGSVNLEFKGKRENLFIYTDRSMYFNFIYPFGLAGGATNTGITPNYGTPSVNFLPKIQNLPKNPVTFNNNGLVDFMKYATINTPLSDSYYPVNYQINGSVNPQMEYLRFFNGLKPSNIQQPEPTGTVLAWADLFKIPLLNVKYALINKRASDYGIVAPKNL